MCLSVQESKIDIFWKTLSTQQEMCQTWNLNALCFTHALIILPHSPAGTLFCAVHNNWTCIWQHIWHCRFRHMIQNIDHNSPPVWWTIGWIMDEFSAVIKENQLQQKWVLIFMNESSNLILFYSFYSVSLKYTWYQLICSRNIHKGKVEAVFVMYN